MKLKNFIVIILSVLSSTIFCQENKKSDAGGAPVRAEIIGFWKKVNVPKLEKMNKENPWPQTYQWFAFYQDGRVFSMMSDKDENYTEKDLQEIFEVLKDKTPKFRYNGKFMFIINPEITNYREVWGMNLFAKDVGTYIKKGDLMMSLDDGSGQGNKSIIYYRLLRKIN